MQSLHTLIPETLLPLVIKKFKRNEKEEQQHQSRLVRLISDKHRLDRLRSSLRGSFRESFLDVALSDAQFAQMACMIAEFQQYLLHDDVLALALYNEEAALEIFINEELCTQLNAEEVSTILLRHPHTTHVLLEVAQQQQITLDAANLTPFMQQRANVSVF